MKILFFIFAILFLSSSSFAGVFETIPSETLKREILTSSIPPETQLEMLVTDTTAREDMFISAWGLATQSSPVDNRAYLYSLAVDLYNSMGTDVSHCHFVDDNPPGCGKSGAWGEISKTTYWENWGNGGVRTWNMGKPKKITWSLEKWYLADFVREHLDMTQQQPATLLSSEIDLVSPTLYKPMRRWMAEQTTAMLGGIPPWEAEEWTTANKAAWERNKALAGAGVTTNGAVTTQGVTQEASPPNPAPQSSAVISPGGKKPAPADAVKKEVARQPPTKGTHEPPANPAVPWWVWVIGGVVLLVGGLLKRRKRRG